MSPAISILTVTGVHKEDRSVTQAQDISGDAAAAAAAAESQLTLFPVRTVTVEKRPHGIDMQVSRNSVWKHIRAAVRPNRHSESLAILMLEKRAFNAKLVVFEGEETHLNQTIRTGDFWHNKWNELLPKKTKVCATIKNSNPSKGNLYMVNINSLGDFVDFQNGESCCHLVIVSKGEAAQAFQRFMKTEAASRKHVPLLHMANNAVVVDATNPNTSQPLSKKGGKKAGRKSSWSSSSDYSTTLTHPPKIGDKSKDYFDDMMKRLNILTQINDIRFSKSSTLVKEVSGALGRRNKSMFQNKKFMDTLSSLFVSVREQGGAVHILCDAHECGQRLAKIGGVAALLTFPLFGLDDLGD
ncbi:Translation factor pelota [Sporothrix bragantina]|uniref:Translation factor pelota n=1 Tax=Sporothrix bragantina TaxID=671064 RepID=A0ABP0CVF5_9PEZI